MRTPSRPARGPGKMPGSWAFAILLKPFLLTRVEGSMNAPFLASLALFVAAQTAPAPAQVDLNAQARLAPAEVKEAFRKLLDRPKVALDVVAEKPQTADGLTTEHLTFASEKKADGTIERVPAIVVRPEAT